MTAPSATHGSRHHGRRLSHRVLGAVALVAMVGLSACGSDSDSDTSTATTETAKECRTGADAAAASAPDLDPPTAPATELEITDPIEGCGDEIAAGAVTNVTVNYLGKAESNGEQFDSSFDRGEPASFPVGAAQLIQGWDEGLVGMKEGGRRVLLVPGDLAYGPDGRPPAIGSDDTLVFVIDLISIDD
ncbi:MAG: FKBP-type peptidyl-prolyl cis-trans isomerase [Aquihabitans sp.]